MFSALMLLSVFPYLFALLSGSTHQIRLFAGVNVNCQAKR